MCVLVDRPFRAVRRVEASDLNKVAFLADLDLDPLVKQLPQFGKCFHGPVLARRMRRVVSHRLLNGCSRGVKSLRGIPCGFQTRRGQRFGAPSPLRRSGLLRRLYPVVHLLRPAADVGLLHERHRARVLDLGQRLQCCPALRLRFECQRQINLKLLQPIIARRTSCQ